MLLPLLHHFCNKYFTSVHVQFVGYNLKVSQFRHVLCYLITSNTTRIFTECRILKPASLCRVASSGMTFIQIFVKMDQTVQKIQCKTRTQYVDLINLPFFKGRKEYAKGMLLISLRCVCVCVCVCVCETERESERERESHNDMRLLLQLMNRYRSFKYERYIARMPPHCQFLSFLKSVKSPWLTSELVIRQRHLLVGPYMMVTDLRTIWNFYYGNIKVQCKTRALVNTFFCVALNGSYWSTDDGCLVEWFGRNLTHQSFRRT